MLWINTAGEATARTNDVSHVIEPAAPPLADKAMPPPYQPASLSMPIPATRVTVMYVIFALILIAVSGLAVHGAQSCWAAGCYAPVCDTGGTMCCCLDHSCEERADLTGLTCSWWKRKNPLCDRYSCMYKWVSSERIPTGAPISANQVAIEPAQTVYTGTYPYHVCYIATVGAAITSLLSCYAGLIVCRLVLVCNS